jgi:glutamyl-tRNA reductase
VSVYALGLNHTTAPLALRERFAFGSTALAPAAQSLAGRFGHGSASAEVAIVSTCNRTEVYLGAEAGVVDAAMDWLAEAGRTDRSDLKQHAYVLEDGAAARHAFRVASGLDSMVLGEPQILGQFKHAMREAESAGTLGGTLHHMFQRSFSVAKEVRSSTAIGAQSVSMAAACVRLASQIFGQLDETSVLFVGAGPMIELAATHFAAQHPRSMTFANRTLERAEVLSTRFGARALRFADMPETLSEFDIIVSCTASSVPIIGLGAIERAIKRRRRRPMFIVDLAVPRDVEPEVGDLPDVYLHTVDHLAAIVKTNGAQREAAVTRAEAIIETGVVDFVHWLKQRRTIPLIQALQGQADAWRAVEIERAKRQLARGDDLDAVLQSMSRGLTQKMLHGALVELKALPDDADVKQGSPGTIARVFRLDEVRQSSSSINRYPTPVTVSK